MKVYHYTTKKSLTSIINSKIFTPSVLSPLLDSAYGKGHYFTDLSPESEDITISRSLWNSSNTNKIEAYISFEIEESLLQECRQNVYRLPIGVIESNNINLDLEYPNNKNQNKIMIKYIGNGIRKIKNGNNVWETIGTISIIGLGIIILKNIFK